MMQANYLVTKTPELEGRHFLHCESCQVLPDQEMHDLGPFDGCEQAMKKAAELYDPLNACALCCSDCYIKSADLQD